ncbi:Abi-like protein [Schaalia odontolytica]|uniref:Abi-like protein n=1 Tax=Schaalia odontolytica TaxID=1660 RepID=A0A6N2SJM3_9ACTO
MILDLAGSARLAPYLQEADGDDERARELYLWAADLAGALFSTIAFVEVGLRNAMDRKLRAWNDQQGIDYGEDWALRKGAAPLLYDLVTHKSLASAQNFAVEQSRLRPKTHPRRLVAITHDDVVSHFMFGTWVYLIKPRVWNQPQQCQQLWQECLSHAFPYADPSDSGRERLGDQLDRVRKLRNRVAHHENLLSVDIRRRLRDMLGILALIDPKLPDLAMQGNRVRSLVRTDPRRSW